MKVLVTGVSGLLGLNLAVALRARHSVSGAYFQHPVLPEDVRTERVDASDPAAVRAWFGRECPELVVHTSGLTNVDSCETNPVAARHLNVGAARVVAGAAAEAGATLLHISTDHLFDGRESMYTEEHRASPLNVYAATKLEAESAVRDAHPGPYIVRTNFYGWGHALRQSFSDWILSTLKSGETPSMFEDVYFTPILVNDLVDVIVDLSRTGKPGIYNVAGGERLSKFAFGVALAKQFGFDPSRIKPLSVESFAFKARRPRDMSLATTKVAGAVGYPMPDAATGLDRLARLEREGLPAALAAALGD